MLSARVRAFSSPRTSRPGVDRNTHRLPDRFRRIAPRRFPRPPLIDYADTSRPSMSNTLNFTLDSFGNSKLDRRARVEWVGEILLQRKAVGRPRDTPTPVATSERGRPPDASVARARKKIAVMRRKSLNE